MKNKSSIQGEHRWDAAALDELIDEFTVEAAGDDERVLAFLQALEKHVALPCDGFVIGEPVSVVKFDYQGQRRGLTAKCRRMDGREYEVTASEVALAADTPGSHYLAAYRKWMGVVPYPAETRSTTSPKSPAAALDLRGLVELVVLSVSKGPLVAGCSVATRASCSAPAACGPWFPARSPWSGRASSGIMPAILISPV